MGKMGEKWGQSPIKGIRLKPKTPSTRQPRKRTIAVDEVERSRFRRRPATGLSEG